MMMPVAVKCPSDDGEMREIFFSLQAAVFKRFYFTSENNTTLFLLVPARCVMVCVRAPFR
jgi:hypothetical protein